MLTRQLGGQAFELLALARREHQVGAAIGQRLGDRAPEAAGRAREQNCLSARIDVETLKLCAQKADTQA